MVTWNEIRSWNPREVHHAADRVHRSARNLTDLTDRFTDVVPADWTGDAASAARACLEDLNRDAGARAEVLRTVGRCLTDTATAMSPLLAAVRDAEDTAVGNDFLVDADARVRDRVQEMASAGGEMWSIVRDRRRMEAELQDRIDQLLTEARVLDDSAARALRAAETDSDVRVLPASAPVDGTPAANAAYWQSLPESARTALLVSSPELIGNMDGIPAHVRDRANRRVLATERIRLVAEERALARELEDDTFGGWLSNADAGLEQTRKRIRAIDALTDTVNQGDRQLLVFDNSSYEETMAAVAVGNVDTATHVAVFVPGLSSTVQGSVDTYDGSMKDLKDAVQLQLSDTSDKVACVTWMDYRAPQFGWDLVDPDGSVLSGAPANAGGERLTEFLNGLDAARSTDPHLSLLGHSYGSLTAAAALGSDTGVDDFVAMGSPGLGTVDVSSLSVPAGHSFVAEADDDLVADLAAFGPDPSHLPGVTALATGDDGTHLPSEGHSGYLAEGSVGQWGTAAVVAGRPPAP